MMNLVNNFGGQNQPVRQNPDEYAKSYAEQNGISFEEAKAELKAKYGDPQQQGGTSSIGSYGNCGNIGAQDISSIQNEIASLEEKLFGGQESGNSILSFLMNILNGGNNASNNSGTSEKTETTQTTEQTETTTTNNTTDSDKTETTTNDTTETTEIENESETTSTNRIKEYKDKTLYKYLRNEVGLSDSEIAKLSEDDEKKYKKGLHNRIGNMTLKRYYASLDE